MNVRDQVMKENSRRNWLQSVDFIGTDKKRIAELMKLFFSKDIREMQVSSQVVSEMGDKHPKLIQPYLSKMIVHLNTNPIDAFKRVTIRLCQFMDVPEQLEGELFEKGIQYLKSPEESIAAKAFSMTALRRICEKYPELASELIPYIEILVDQKASAGIVNRGQKELKFLRKLESKLKK
jgi:hypothetical protein